MGHTSLGVFFGEVESQLVKRDNLTTATTTSLPVGPKLSDEQNTSQGNCARRFRRCTYCNCFVLIWREFISRSSEVVLEIGCALVVQATRTHLARVTGTTCRSSRPLRPVVQVHLRKVDLKFLEIHVWGSWHVGTHPHMIEWERTMHTCWCIYRNAEKEPCPSCQLPTIFFAIHAVCLRMKRISNHKTHLV